jgi:thiamine biosynthesis lipoprotein ApbE
MDHHKWPTIRHRDEAKPTTEHSDETERTMDEEEKREQELEREMTEWAKTARSDDLIEWIAALAHDEPINWGPFMYELLKRTAEFDREHAFHYPKERKGW